MTFFIGLGNPGSKYFASRHNMGFSILDQLQKSIAGQTQSVPEWKSEKALEAQTYTVQGTLFVKPQTFMNLSGKAVHAAVKKYDYGSLAKKDFHSLYLIYDDLDIEVGKYRIDFGSGPKIHNGVNSVKESLGTDQFWHVRIGVDGRKGDRSFDPQDYVLSGFSTDEQTLIEKVKESVCELLAQKILGEHT